MSKQIKYPKEPDDFLLVTKTRVNDYFSNNNISKYGDQIILQKNLTIGCLLLVIYILSVTSEYGWITVLAYALIGILTIVLAINVVHDAVHGVAHSNKRINDVLMRQMDLLGPNAFIWKLRHKAGHHSFPNILDNDPDLKQSVIARIFPNAPRFSFHRYQHIYVPILYAFYTINWVYIRDFRDLADSKTRSKMTHKEILYFFIFKFVYISIFVLLPIWICGLSWQLVLISNAFMHIAASYFLTIALVPSHVCEHSIFPLPDENGVLPYAWSHHQVMTTSDYATDSKVMTWLLGGFNHHVVHHLFPDVSHVHYFILTPVVKRTIIQFNLPYQHLNSIVDAYKSHFYLLKNNGKK